MPREVAHAYLLAVAEAWPFVSESAHRLQILRLTRTAHLLYDRPTQALVDDLVAWLRPRAAGLSIDALRRRCDFAWFDEAPLERPLADVLFDLAARTLQSGGAAVHLRRDSDLPERLAHFRWLSLLLPPDLLLAAFTPEPLTDRVSLLTPQLAEMLTERPVAETHVHLNAAMPFADLWTGLASGFAHHAPQRFRFGHASPPPFGDPGRFLSVLAAAFIVRLLLARFLWNRDRTGASSLLADMLDDDVGIIAKQLGWPGGRGSARFALYEAMRRLDIGDGSPALSYPAFCLLYRLLLGPAPTDTATTLDDLQRRDPLSAWLPPRPGRASPETRFAARAIAYLRGAGEDDTAFARLFWQYERVRCLTYRYLVHEPGTSGLDWFQQHFRRSSALRAALDRCRLEIALAHARPGIRLGAFEARISPNGTAAEMLGEIRVPVRRPPSEIGIDIVRNLVLGLPPTAIAAHA